MLVHDMYSVGGSYRFIPCSTTCHIMHYYSSYCLYPICQYQLLAPSTCRLQVNMCWETASLIAFFQLCFGLSFMHPVMKVQFCMRVGWDAGVTNCMSISV